MERLNSTFTERLAEIDAYIGLLQSIEEQARNGPPKIEGATHPITVQQQRILYSSLFLQLYNLVEATMTLCIEAVAEAAMNDSKWRPRDLSNEILKEWVRARARTHTDLTADNRLQNVLEAIDSLIEDLPIVGFSIEKGGGGNWDDESIEKISKRLGFKLRIKKSIYSDTKKKFRDEMGPLELVKSFRNRLAHGAISFAECSDGLTVTQLCDLKEKTVNYLREVASCFIAYIESFGFIIESKRPA